MWFTIKCHCKCSEFQFMKKRGSQIHFIGEDGKIRWKSLVSLSRGDSDITVFPSGSKIERFRGETGWKDSVSTVKVSRNDIIARRFSSVHLSSPPSPSPFFRRFLDNMAMIFQNLGMENVCHVEHPKGVNAYRDNINFESTFRYIFHSHSRCSTCYCYIYILCSIITF